MVKSGQMKSCQHWLDFCLLKSQACIHWKHLSLVCAWKLISLAQLIHLLFLSQLNSLSCRIPFYYCFPLHLSKIMDSNIVIWQTSLHNSLLPQFTCVCSLNAANIWEQAERSSAWVQVVFFYKFCMSRQSPSLYRIPIQTPNYHLADCRKCAFVFFFMKAQKLQEITFGICLFPFSQGQKPGLTDVQAELDRMTRKQDSVVSANNIPPTENEAWRQRNGCVVHCVNTLETIHVHVSINRKEKKKNLTKFPTPVSVSTHCRFHQMSFRCDQTVRWDER